MGTFVSSKFINALLQDEPDKKLVEEIIQTFEKIHMSDTATSGIEF